MLSENTKEERVRGDMKIQITRYLDFFFKPQVCVALSNEISGLQFPDIKIGIRTANITEDFPQL